MVIHQLSSIIIAIILGFLTGLGTGGGSLLVLWLTFVQNVTPLDAKIINLMFFLPCALIAGFINWKNGRVPFKKILLPASIGCITAALFSVLAQKIDTEQLKKLFGVMLILIGTRELLYRARKPK